MQITKCDRCGAEIGQGKPKFKVIIENSAPGVFRETEEVIDDLCSTCRFQLHEFFHPTEPVPVLLNTDKVRKEAEEDFWATHDPSGGDLPPENDENDEKSVGKNMKWITKKTIPTSAAGSGKKKSQVDVGKIGALWKAGWTQKKIAEEMGIKQCTVSYHLAKLREMNEKGNDGQDDREKGDDQV